MAARRLRCGCDWWGPGERDISRCVRDYDQPYWVIRQRFEREG